MNKKIVAILVIMLLIGTIMSMNGFDVYSVNVNAKSNSFKNFLNVQNGTILDQQLDDNGFGYTVMCVWGSYYDMGYAQAELIGDYIVKLINEVKDFLGDDYDQIRDICDDAVFIPSCVEDEYQGIVDCLAVSHPNENIDVLDLKMANTFGDWSYACRSHTCWGRYVSDSIKTLSTRRLDFMAPFSSAYHHVLCAYVPNDGSTRWINFAWPGLILVETSINEFGTLVSSHDYQSTNPDITAGRMSRAVAFRYATTFASDSDISTHVDMVYSELQKYEIMTGTFLNYYAPEGYGGVMTCNPFESGPDFYDLRKPQESWHHGEAMITTNSWTDGTYTPDDEDFGADSYYGDESSKTLESHWNLLYYDGAGGRGIQQISLAYRGWKDMTIWFDGRTSSMGQKTQKLEWEWSDLFIAEPPTTPIINGQKNGKQDVEYEYKFMSVDSNGDDVNYTVDWGDQSELLTIGPFESGVEAPASHIWTEEGNYIIKVEAEDTVTGVKSEWGTLEISMPKTKTSNSPLLNFFVNHPNLFLRLRQLLGL